jgi:hypothetical protein
MIGYGASCGRPRARQGSTRPCDDKDQQRAAVFDKLQQSRIELNQLLMRFVARLSMMIV